MNYAILTALHMIIDGYQCHWALRLPLDGALAYQWSATQAAYQTKTYYNTFKICLC